MGQPGDSPMSEGYRSEGYTTRSEPLHEQPTTEAENARTVETVLQAVTKDLTALQQGVIGQLSRDITRLQAEKTRLVTDIDKLQTHYQTLQSRQLETLSQQQIAQQQLWAKQLAQVLASHLQALMIQRLNQLATPQTAATAQTNSVPLTPANGQGDNAHRLLASLDATFSTTFKALQQDLNSYQSSLSQQLNRMQSLEQQGEAILAALIDRLRDQLQVEASRAVSPQPSREHGYPRENGHHKEDEAWRSGNEAQPLTNGGATQLHSLQPLPSHVGSGQSHSLPNQAHVPTQPATSQTATPQIASAIQPR